MAQAKQTKNAAAPAAPTAPTGAAATTDAEKGANDKFTRVFVDGKPAPPTKTVNGKVEPAKLAPQAQHIANVLEAAGEGTTLTRKELVDKLITTGLKTKQPPGRILSYYQKELVAKGVIELSK